MGTAFLYGNGGGIDNLKFRVYSATSLPSSGKENDVCIITSTPISSWEAGSVGNPAWSMDAGFVYLTCDASDASQPNLLRKNALYLKLMRCWQYEKGTWSTKDAYQYRGGAWVQFSSNFSATINVTYPAGSICTATDGVTTLAAPDTSGTWDCVVPNAGTWTVTAKTSDAAHIATQSVSITSSGQTVSVSLSYVLMIYDRGTINSSIGMTTDGYTYSGDNEKNVTFGSASIDIAGNTNVAGTTSAVDVTNYSTLRVTMKSGNTSNTTQPWCALCKTKTTTGDNLINRTSAGSADKITKRIDISSLSGSYYIVIASSSSSGWGTIYDIYLEY